MPPRPRIRILVVDDDAGVRELVRTHLQLAGFEVHAARNGLHGVQTVRAMQPHGMVLDINMPELDGFSVLERLTEEAILPPTMVLTARHAAEDVRRAVKLGAKDYLAKPFTESQLLSRIARLMRPPLAVPPSVAI